MKEIYNHKKYNSLLDAINDDNAVKEFEQATKDNKIIRLI